MLAVGPGWSGALLATTPIPFAPSRMHCPSDGATLVRTRIAPGANVHACPRCEGRAVAMPVVRRQLAADAARALWQGAVSAAPLHLHGTRCPSCRRMMARVPAAAGGDALELDVCTACQLVWFDPREADQLPAPAAVAAEELGAPWREHVARRNEQARWSGRRWRSTDEPWPAMLEPVHVRRAQGWPWGTWLLVGLVAASSVFAFWSKAWMDAMSVVSSWRRGGWALAWFFVHASWAHLLANLVFLTAFGAEVERRVGEGRWLLVLGSATILSSLVQWFVDGRSPWGCVGADGGITGLVVFWALLRPHALLPTGFAREGGAQPSRSFAISARAGLVAWIGVQAWLIGAEVRGPLAVTAAGVLTGAMAGGLAWLAWRDGSSA